MKQTSLPNRIPTLDSYPSGDGDFAEMDSLGRVPIGDTDNLDETVLGAAAVGIPERLPPELARGTETLTEWDEAAGESGTWTPRVGSDDGVLDVERLVEAGIEEADRERRLAAGRTED